MSLNPAVQVMLSGGLSLGVPLMIAIYELRSLRPKRDGSRPLPACLIPTEQWRAPARPRELV
jgi:hypothetical protein